MKLFLQIIKEFWFPLTVAIIWASYNYTQTASENKQLTTFVNLFGASFFFVSWLTAQYFRVKKQTRVEDALSRNEEKSKEILERLENQVLKIQNTSLDMLERLAFNAVKDRVGMNNYETITPAHSDIPTNPDTPHIIYFCVSHFDSYTGNLNVIFRVIDEGINFNGHKNDSLIIHINNNVEKTFSAESHEYGFYSSTIELPESGYPENHNINFSLKDNSGNLHTQTITVSNGVTH